MRWRRRKDREEELERGLHSDLELEAEEQRENGLSPEDARYAARRALGNATLVKEDVRRVWGWTYLEWFRQDLCYGLRGLRRRPGFAIAAGLSLALGIGVTTAIFAVLNAVALRPLPYADPSRLVWITQVLRGSSTDELTITADFLDWRRLSRSFSHLAGYNHQIRNLTGVEPPVEVRTARVSASLLPMLGVNPAIGRNFRRDEDLAGNDAVAVLAYNFWQQQFGGNRNVIGQPVTLDGRAFTVIGVLPEGLIFPGSDPVDLLTPLAKNEAVESQRGQDASIIFDVLARLKPGATLEQAHAELTSLQAHLPNFLPWHPQITIRMLPLQDHLFGNAATASLVLLGSTGFLLLIACANVSNLLLVRLAQRDRELAVRTVLGGSRTRLVAHLLTESAVLGAFACGAGILLALWLRRPLVRFSPYHPAGLEDLPFDGRVLAFAITAGMLTTMLFAVLPAFRATGMHLADAIRGGASGVVGGRKSMRMLSLVAAAQVAMTLVLSSGAGLMLESFWHMRYGNLGFQPDHLIAATLHLTTPRYRDYSQRRAFLDRLLERARDLPGVQAAAVTTAWEIPPGRGRATNVFQIEGRIQPMGSGQRPVGRFQQVSSDYFTLMAIPLLKGRLLRDSDRDVVVNRALVRKYFPNEDLLGHRIVFGEAGDWRTIAGVVGDVKTSGLASAPEPAIYYSYRGATPSSDVGLILRSPLAAGAIASELRRMVAEIDTSQPIATIEAMNERLSTSVSGPRFAAVLLAAFALLALVLGSLGVYGVMACRIRWQLRELAVRQALGASPRDVIRQVMRQGLSVVLPGVVLGVAGALAASRSLASLLYGVKANDPRTLALVAAVLVAVALAACSIPAIRAARVDPMDALRSE